MAEVYISKVVRRGLDYSFHRENSNKMQTSATSVHTSGYDESA